MALPSPHLRVLSEIFQRLIEVWFHRDQTARTTELPGAFLRCPWDQLDRQFLPGQDQDFFAGNGRPDEVSQLGPRLFDCSRMNCLVSHAAITFMNIIPGDR